MLLVLVYLLLFFTIINRCDFFKRSGIPPIWLNGLFALKILVSVVIYFIYTKFYTDRTTADIFRYFDDSLILYNAFWEKPQDFWKLLLGTAPKNAYFFEHYYVRMNNWADARQSFIYGDSLLMIKINALLRFISNGNFFIHTLWFNFIGFVGLTAIYKGSLYLFKKTSSLLILATYCMPSVLFWTSGLLKESLLMFFIGLIYWAVMSFFFKKDNLMLLLIPFALIGIAYLKFYIIVALFPSVIAFIISSYFKKINPLFFFLSVITILTGIITLFFPEFIKTLVLKQHDFIVYNSNAGSYFDLPLLENNLLNIIKHIPNALLNCFVRPLPSSQISLMAIPAIVENFIIIVAITGLIVTGFRKIKQISFSYAEQRWLWFIIFYILILFAIIGLTTPVAGALVRYKVAALPFLATLILYLYSKIFIQNKAHKSF